MDIQKAKRVFMEMQKAGATRTELWFKGKGFSELELEEAVANGWLIKIEKDPSDFMSDIRYQLTQKGFDLAWQ